MRAAVDVRFATQDGLITRSQSLEAGMSTAAVDRRVRTGAWIRVHPSVFRSAQVALTAAGRARAAVLWAGDQATLSGAAAAWWWSLTDVEPMITEVTLPRRVIRRAPTGVRVIRRDLAAVDRSVVRGVAVTSLPLSALHGAVALGSPAGPMMLDHALQRRVSFEELHAAYCRQIGSARAAGARRLIAVAGDRAAAESERMLIRMLKSAGIHGWSVNTEITIRGHVWSPDFCFAKQRLIIEVDGWAWHHTPDRFRRDRQRQNQLVLAGWTVLRFTWFDLVDRPAWVIAQIRLALSGRSLVG